MTILLIITVLVFVTAIAAFAVRKGFWDVKINIERQSVIGSIDAISEGASIFNHTLKNEVGKVSIAASNLEYMRSRENIDLKRITENIEVMENSISNLHVMALRVQDFSRNIKLNDSLYSVEEVLDKAVENVSVFLKEKNIALVKNYAFKIQILCDKEHIVEAVTNILKNACEALNYGGQIKVGAHGKKSVLYISISDNGPGIKKEYLSKVFEPFFTTKDGSKNFGFGLSYAYKVLNKHRGDLNIYSRENAGTTVTLSIPGFRIKVYDKNLPGNSK